MQLSVLCVLCHAQHGPHQNQYPNSLIFWLMPNKIVAPSFNFCSNVTVFMRKAGGMCNLQNLQNLDSRHS